MKFVYEYSNPDQLAKITFPYSGKISFYLIGGGGGRGGNDAGSQGHPGQHGAYFSGEFQIANNTTLVVCAGGGGKRGVSGAAGWGGGAGGESILLPGGVGGNAGGGGSSGAGGGGGAASFIMTEATYNSLLNAISTNNFDNLDWPHFTAGGGGGGGGAGLYSWGRTSIPTDGGTTIVKTVSKLQDLYGGAGVNKGGDGGGGGGGGSGWSKPFLGNFIIGGGMGGTTVGGDSGAFTGTAGSSYITNKSGGGISLITIFQRYTERNASSIRPLNQPLFQLPYDNKGLGGGNTNSTSWDGGDGYVRLEYTPDNQDISEIYTKRNASFTKVPEIFVRANNNNIWQQVKDVYVKDNGSWVNVFHLVPDNEYTPTLQNLNTVVRGPQNKGSDVGWVATNWGTWYSYNAFLWNYAVSRASIWTLGANEFTTTVFIPVAGNYRMFVASDNSGYCVINCKRGTSLDSYNSWPGYKEYIVNLPKGEVYLTAGYTNNEGPGGIAVQLTDMAGNNVWNTRSWVAGTYNFKYNTVDAGLIGGAICGTITDLTPEAPPPEPPPEVYDGGGGG